MNKLKFLAGYIKTQWETTIHKGRVLLNIVDVIKKLDPPSNGRPFWTVQNSKGNIIGDLYDEELDKYGLSSYKKFPLIDRKEGSLIKK